MRLSLVRRQIVKTTSGDVMTHGSLAFYYGKCLVVLHTLHSTFTSHFNDVTLFERPSSKIKYSIIKIRYKIIISLSFVQKIRTI